MFSATVFILRDENETERKFNNENKNFKNINNNKIIKE